MRNTTLWPSGALLFLLTALGAACGSDPGVADDGGPGSGDDDSTADPSSIPLGTLCYSILSDPGFLDDTRFCAADPSATRSVVDGNVHFTAEGSFAYEAQSDDREGVISVRMSIPDGASLPREGNVSRLYVQPIAFGTCDYWNRDPYGNCNRDSRRGACSTDSSFGQIFERDVTANVYTLSPDEVIATFSEEVPPDALATVCFCSSSCGDPATFSVAGPIRFEGEIHLNF